MELSEWGKNSLKEDETNVPHDTQFIPLAKYYGDWEALLTTHKEMLDIVNSNDLSWLGDDFEDIQNYIFEVETYVKDFYLDVNFGGWDDELAMYVRQLGKNDLIRMKERYDGKRLEYEQV